MAFDLIGWSDFAVWVLAISVISYGITKGNEARTWTLETAFNWVCFSSLWVFRNSLNLLPADPILRLYDMAALSALVSFLLTAATINCFRLQTWINIFKVVGVFNAGLLIGGFIYAPHKESWGLLLNASMSGCLSACIFPLFTFSKKERWFKTLLLVSVLASARSQPVAVLFATFAAKFILEKDLGGIFGLLPISLAVGFLVKGKSLFESQGRTEIWLTTYNYFKDHVNPFSGAGLGSFYILGQYLSHGVFIWLHSDWGQILFETGLIGFILVTILYGHALWRARHSPDLFCALIGYGVFAMANMPLRYPIAGLYGAFLIRWAFE